ncbi:hypothetical protein CMV_024472 [Castanea mollissima]|uniref:Uncharacterized protein n=1 Tax=Castanea mollissima TaxID=60419 RepID=A0A8J4VCG0_9ROSI|nr:hypothetical protein CMV_024472 [Castanea mollissima]
MIAKSFSHPSGSKGKPSEAGFIMGSEFEKQDSNIISIFLELLGFDDLIGFKSSMEEGCHYINEGSLCCVDVNQACGLNGLLHFLFVAAVDFAISATIGKDTVLCVPKWCRSIRMDKSVVEQNVSSLMTKSATNA